MGSRVRVPSGPPETKVFGSLWIKDFFILIQGVEILLKMICTCPKMKPFRWRTEWKLWGYEVSIKTKKTWKIFFQVFFCGQWWIRTTEGESQLSYSQPHLATLVTALLSLLSDSNQRPRDYKSRALANWAKEAFIFYQYQSLSIAGARVRIIF